MFNACPTLAVVFGTRVDAANGGTTGGVEPDPGNSPPITPKNAVPVS